YDGIVTPTLATSILFTLTSQTSHAPPSPAPPPTTTIIIMTSIGTGYNLSASTYSPDGRIFQVEYANKAVENSGTVIRLKCKDGVILAVEKLVQSKLLVPESNKRLRTVDLHVGLIHHGCGATLIGSGKNNTTDEEGPTTKWICRYCSERVLINWQRHSRLPTHQTRISECDPDLDGTTRGNVSEESRLSTVNVANDSSDKESNLGFEENVLDQDGLLQEIEDTPMDINVSTEEAPTIDMFEAAKENGPKTSNLGDIDWTDLIPDTLDQILHEEEEEYEHVCQFDEENGEDDIENEIGESGKDSPWFPFRNKNILKIVFDLNLPGWEALRRERKKIREICSVSLNEKTSSTGKTCFALSVSAKEIIKQELLNPLVNQHMEYFPQDSEGQNIFKLSQSQRWLSELSPKTRVQMCTSNNKQYYIFEPVQLRNSVDIVIPIFFYKKHDRTFSKCVRPEISSKSAGSELVLQIDSHLTFNDPRLISFPIEKLDLIYPDIRLKSGRKLADFCNDCITEIYQLKKQKKKLTKNKEPIPQNMKSDIPQHILDIEKDNPDDLFNPFLELEAQEPERPTVGKINSIWCVQKPQHQSRYLLHLMILKKKGVNDWYQMQEFKVTSKSLFVNTTAVASTLNFQHNCHNGNCTLTKTKTVRIERIDSVVKALEVTHENRLDYILNTCSLHAINFHQKTAELEFRTIEPLEWLNAMHEGLATWKSNKKKGKTVIPITSAISRVNPSFLATAGLLADGRQLGHRATSEAASYEQYYNDPIPIQIDYVKLILYVDPYKLKLESKSAREAVEHAARIFTSLPN
ncbi:hypothetical protein PSHT_11074, partial [Puccinia striiformis]